LWRGRREASLTVVLSQEPTQPPVPASRVERRSAASRRRILLLVVPAALVAVAAVLLLLLGGGNGGGIPFIGDDEDHTVPEFDFRVSPKTAVVATSADADVEALRPAAEQAGAEVTAVLDELYTAAFLDPTNWREGDYEEVFAFFADGAVGAAREAVETLALGAGAGDVFEKVTPRRGRLAFRVLFDPDGAADTVVARVRFRALAERTDGTYQTIVSQGQFFLRDVGGWKVTAFDVERKDREAKPPAPAPSASPSA